MSLKTIFDFKYVDGDTTLQDVRNEERFFGYRESEPLVFNSDYEKLYNDIMCDPFIMNSTLPSTLFVDRNAIKRGNSLWDELGITLCDVDIISKKYNLNKYTGIITNDFIDALSTDSPLKIPVRFHDKNIYGGAVQLNMEDPNDPSNNGVIFREIIVPKVKGVLSSCCYAHEITHTQELSTIGLNSSLLNRETIPMLIEQIFASKLDQTGDALKKIRYWRLWNLAKMLHDFATVKYIAYVSKAQFDTYIQSTIQSIKLANEFIFGSENVKKEIINYINKFFAGDIIVDEILNHFEANLEEVPKDLKVLRIVK